MDENEFMLEDRIAKIRAINNQYDLLNNGYISFSGGRDSKITSDLFDIALPNNKIPRLFLNTGIEYSKMVKYVKRLAEKDDRIIIYNSGVNINKMLNEYGYPFKSKQHSHNWAIFNNNREEIYKYIDMINKDKSLLENYHFIHNLPKGVKTIIKYVYGIREKIEKDTHDSVVERERVISTSIKGCPNKLLYQFEGCPNTNIKYSDMCCYKMKKEPAHRWEQENNRHIAITGMRAEEGGMRNQNGCTIFDDDNKLKKFHPLKVVSKEWEDWFIKKYNVELCELYYPPYNFKRTGCKGCPFALDLQEQLDKMKELLPNDYKQCEILWKPVYDEYRRIGYRLDKNTNQMSIFDFMEE